MCRYCTYLLLPPVGRGEYGNQIIFLYHCPESVQKMDISSVLQDVYIFTENTRLIKEFVFEAGGVLL